MLQNRNDKREEKEEPSSKWDTNPGPLKLHSSAQPSQIGRFKFQEDSWNLLNLPVPFLFTNSEGLQVLLSHLTAIQTFIFTLIEKICALVKGSSGSGQLYEWKDGGKKFLHL